MNLQTLILPLKDFHYSAEGPKEMKRLVNIPVDRGKNKGSGRDDTAKAWDTLAGAYSKRLCEPTFR
jgi:hypothetical protein